MSIEIKMPRLSDTMEQGTLIKWNKSEGDEVSAGDVVADVETDKATMEMQVFDDGTIAKFLVQEGQTVDVGTTIALLAEEDEDIKDVASKAGEASAGASANGEQKQEDNKHEAQTQAQRDEGEQQREAAEASEQRDRAEPAEREQEPAAEDQQKKAPSDREQPAATAGKEPQAPQRESDEPQRGNGAPVKQDGRLRVSPVARRLAEEHNIDLRSVQGSGPSGRIIKRDIQHAIETGEETTAAAAPSGGEIAPAQQRGVQPTAVSTAGPLAPQAAGYGLQEQTIELSNMRRTIARRLVESKQTVPHYQVTAVFDMDALLDQRRDLNEQLADQGVKLSVNDFLVRACALAMYEHPYFNASWEDEQIRVHGRVNIAIAISLPEERGGGLVVATIYDADRKTLREISWESKQLAEKARTRGLTTDEMAESTFTLSNLGMYGVEHFTAIINPPNSAILAVGAAMQKPVVRNGELTVGHEMSATLSCDHRVIDGAMAARFLQTLRELLEHPATLLV